MAPLATNQPSQPDQEQAAFMVLNHEEPAPAPPPARPRHVLAVRPLQREPPPPPAPGSEFSRALDRKLRRLQAASRPPRKEAEERPRFVTTVKSGQFLLPPPELAALLGLQSLYPSPQSQSQPVVYSYASRPQAVAPRVHTRRKRDASGASVADDKEGEERVAGRGDAGGGGCSKLGAAFGAVRALAAAAAGFQRAAADKINGQTPSGVTHDKRIVRGSTIASHTLAAGDGPESAAARAARTRRRALARRAAAARCRPGTPPPAPGRRHHPIQTEHYLEELYCASAEIEAGTQTDLFVDRPASPVYVPAKTGADAATQIYPGELFDFDLEVQPILEVLVGKTAEQALAEVSQEEELATLREQQRRYMELRDGERAERERLAAHHARLEGEKQRRGAEARQAQAAAIEARERAAAAVLVQGYVAELLPSVLAGLREQGYLVARVERGVGEELLPWLVAAVSTEMEGILTSRDVITEIVRDVVEARAELYRAAGEREGERPQPEDFDSESEELDEQQGEEAVGHKRSSEDSSTAGSHNHLVDN